MHVGLFFKFKQKWKYFLKSIHQFYQFQNEHLPEYFKNVFIFIFAGNQACARIANAKRRPTTHSWDAALSAIYIEGTRLTFELARWPWQPVRFFENNSEIHDICWGIMNTYFLILWILPSGFGGNCCQTWRFILSTRCANDRNFRVSTRPLRPFLVLFVITFEQKHRFLRVHFEASITIFWTIWTIYYVYSAPSVDVYIILSRRLFLFAPRGWRRHFCTITS